MNKYKYSILSFFKNLSDTTSEFPLAVLVEGNVNNEKLIFIIGQNAPNELIKDLDIVSKKMLERITNILDAEIERSIKSDDVMSILEYLYNNNKFNLHISSPLDIPDNIIPTFDYNLNTGKPKEFNEMVYISLALFAKYVLPNDIAKDFLLINEFLQTTSKQNYFEMESPSIRVFKKPTFQPFTLSTQLN